MTAEGHGPGVDRAWYVAYGSNMCGDRLLAYLEGTVDPSPHGSVGGPAPPGARGVDEQGSRHARYGLHRGCADATPPTGVRPVELAHAVTCRGTSPRWGGGVAFVDLWPRPGVRTPARAWLLTVEQVLGIVGQESRRPHDPPRSVLDGLEVGAAVALGGGWYDTLLRLPDIAGRLAITVTTSRALPVTEPTPAYLATIAAGRAERDGAATPTGTPPGPDRVGGSGA